MSSTTSIVEVIQHYQRSIGSSQDDEARVKKEIFFQIN